MKKGDLIQILAQYHQPEGTTFLGVLLFQASINQEITALKAVLTNQDVVHLADEEALPTTAIETIKKVLSAAKNVDKHTALILKNIHDKLFVNKLFGWQQSPNNPSLEESLPLLIMQEISAYAYAEFKRTTKETDAKKKMPPIHSVSRRLFYTSTGQTAWLNALLNHGVRGEQDEVEALLKKYPELASQKGRVTDFSGRVMYCTAYQRARWDGDWYLYRMMEKYMTPAEIKNQREELERRGIGADGINYGSRFDFTDLFTAYKAFIKRANEVSAPNRNQTAAELAELHNLWKTVYQEQAKLPAHVIHQFMHPTRPFLIGAKPPEFGEPNLPRNTKFNDGISVFSKVSNFVFGSSFGLIRYSCGSPYGPPAPWRPGGLGAAAHDFTALSRLVEVITKNHQQTIEETPIPAEATSSTSSLK